MIKVIQGLLLQIFLFMRDLSLSPCGQLQYGFACQLILSLKSWEEITQNVT